MTSKKAKSASPQWSGVQDAGCVTDDAFWLTWNATNRYHLRRPLVSWGMPV
jgi:hypothetical protein